MRGRVAETRDAVGRFAERCLEAFPQVREARRTAVAAEERSAFLASTGPVLDASLDPRETLDAFARLGVPFLADACIVDVLEDDEVVRVAAAALDPAVERMLLEGPLRSETLAEGAAAVAEVLRSGRSAILPVTPAAFGPGLAGSGPAMVVPLRARGRVLGAVSFATLDPAHAYGPRDLVLAEDLARRAALALDNARLFAQQSTVARLLQESLLPTSIPSVEGVQIAGRFRPAGDGTEVGGDFYDVFLGGDGSVVMTIGDVSGKGAAAAALTATARHTLRVAARYETAPAAVLAVLNEVLLERHEPGGKYLTAALCRIVAGPRQATVEIASAGHPAPLILRADGSVRATTARGTVLGYAPDLTLTPDAIELGRGDALVLFTDGLSEVRTADGLLDGERLEALLADCAGRSAVEIAATLDRAAVDLQDGHLRDDLAIAVARVE